VCVSFQAAEEAGRDFVFPAATAGPARTLDATTFLVRNTPAARAFLVEWWAAASAGVGGGCLPLDGAALHAVLLRRLDRAHRNQRANQRAARDAAQGPGGDDRDAPRHHPRPRAGRSSGDGDAFGTTALTGPWG
jgi:hypothetical protein